jgi:hypothetical protein
MPMKRGSDGVARYEAPMLDSWKHDHGLTTHLRPMTPDEVALHFAEACNRELGSLLRVLKERLRSAPWPCRGCGAGIPRRKGQGRPPIWCPTCRAGAPFKVHERERAKVHRAAQKRREGESK